MSKKEHLQIRKKGGVKEIKHRYIYRIKTANVRKVYNLYKRLIIYCYAFKYNHQDYIFTKKRRQKPLTFDEGIRAIWWSIRNIYELENCITPVWSHILSAETTRDFVKTMLFRANFN